MITKHERLWVRLSGKLKKQLVKRAKWEEKSLSELIRDILEDYLEILM